MIKKVVKLQKGHKNLSIGLWTHLMSFQWTIWFSLIFILICSQIWLVFTWKRLPANNKNKNFSLFLTERFTFMVILYSLLRLDKTWSLWIVLWKKWVRRFINFFFICIKGLKAASRFETAWRQVNISVELF